MTLQAIIATFISKTVKNKPIQSINVPVIKPNSVMIATIVANDCMTADAYATAFMAMGLEKARQMADSLPEIEYYVIYADENGKHQIEYSKGMLQYLPKRKQ